MTDSTPPANDPNTHANDSNAHGSSGNGHSSTDGMSHGAPPQNDVKHQEYETLLNNVLGPEKGPESDMRKMMVELVGKLDDFLGGMISNTVHNMEVQAVHQEIDAATQAVNTPEKRAALATAALGPVGGLAEAGAEKAVDLVKPGVDALGNAVSHSPLGTAFGKIKTDFMAGLNDPVKLQAAIDHLSKSTAGQNVDTTHVDGPPTAPKAGPSNAPQQVAVGGPGGH